MNRAHSLVLMGALLSGIGSVIGADPTNSSPAHVAGPRVLTIDLPATLRLVGARNLDVRIAREKVVEAKAANESAAWQFFPAIIPGFGYRRHDNLIQDVAGNIIDVHKESYTVGPTLAAQLDLGDAIYGKLAARQRVMAAEAGIESERQDSVLLAVLGYFDLARAQASVAVAGESVRIAEGFAAQVGQAVGAGIAFKGDALRAEVQADRDRLLLRRSREQVTVASARLVRTLHLESGVELEASDNDLVPLSLVATNAALDALVVQALAARPEVKRSRALVGAARQVRDGARYGPLVPSLGAQVFAGGLGGGIQGSPGRFGESEDYQFTVGWRIGPGGLFDRGRVRAGEARLQLAQLGGDKLSDEITAEVVESVARFRSWSDQLATAGHAVKAAEEGIRLAVQRKEFAVGVVLEQVQAEQDVTRARLDYVTVVAEFNKAQYGVLRAVGAAPTVDAKK